MPCQSKRCRRSDPLANAIATSNCPISYLSRTFRWPTASMWSHRTRHRTRISWRPATKLHLTLVLIDYIFLFFKYIIKLLSVLLGYVKDAPHPTECVACDGKIGQGDLAVIAPKFRDQVSFLNMFLIEMK